MSDRTKELILKTLLVIGSALMLMVFPGCFFLPLLPSIEVATVVFNTILFTMFGVGILFMILLPIFGGLKKKPGKAEKMPLPFTSYDEFMIFLHKSLDERHYSKQSLLPISTVGEVTVYTKSTELWVLDCFAIIRVPELSDELLEKANDRISDILIEYYGKKRITDNVNMISVFCVDRITPTLQMLINSNQQDFKLGRLLVGISFGGKNIYIAKQEEKFGILKYKRLRKEFFQIMELDNTRDGSVS